MAKGNLKAARLRAVLDEGQPSIELLSAAKKAEPKCKDLTQLYVDYIKPPKPEVARAMCEGCPLLRQCRRLARDVKPTWGVWAGEVYLVQGKSKKSLKTA